MLNGFTSNNAFSVAKGNINVVISVVENDDGSITIMANVTDEDGDPIKDHPVEFVLDGKSVGTGITDIYGITSVTVSASKVGNGTHNITVIVIGAGNYNCGSFSIKFAKRSPRYIDPIGPDDDKYDDIGNNIGENNNNPVAFAAMKETGIPLIIILLILMSCIGLLYRKK